MTSHRKHRGLGKDKPWIVYVDVYLHSDVPGDFNIESCLPTHKHTHGGKEEDYLVFDNHKRPGFTILFQLHDETGQGYRFPDSNADAVWSRYGNECPAGPNNDPNKDVFEDAEVIESDQTILKVRYRNQPAHPPAHFRYTLNVTTDGKTPYLALDPGGTGNNGNSK